VTIESLLEKGFSQHGEKETDKLQQLCLQVQAFEKEKYPMTVVTNTMENLPYVKAFSNIRSRYYLQIFSIFFQNPSPRQFYFLPIRMTDSLSVFRENL
jgi:hypothetical protein